jgi:DNA modification methylase
MRNRIKELRYVEASSLRDNEKNWRRHPALQRSALEAVLAEVGIADALIAYEVDGELVLIDGHLRRDLDDNTKWPVLVLDVDAVEADKPLATLDPLAALAQADASVLAELLATVETEDAALAKMLDDLAAAAGIVPELQEKWNVQPGDLWVMRTHGGEHRLICGDCTDETVVAQVMGGTEEQYDLLLTDPPYGVSYADKNEFLNAIDRGNRIQTPIEGDHRSADEMSVFWKQAFGIARGFARPGACYYTTGPQGGDLLLLLLLALRESGFPLRHTLIWAENNHVLGRSDYNYKHEPILYGWVDGAGHRFYGAAGETSLWEIPKPQKSDLHPTTKPVGLFERAIRNSTAKGEIVYDPFLGSGTTLVACERLGRQGIGIELHPPYVAVCLQRLDDEGLKPVKA